MNNRAEAQRAMRIYRSGDVGDAKKLLIALLHENRNCEDAWIGLATCVDNIEHKKKCLREVIRINPYRADIEKILTELEKQSALVQANIEEISTGSLFDRKVIITYLAGVQFDGRPRAIRRLTLGQKLRLIRQPDNQYDVNAINVLTEYKEEIGYVPKKLAAELAPYIDDHGLQLEASVLNLRIDTLGEKYQVEIAIDMDETLVELADLYRNDTSNLEIQYFTEERTTGLYLLFNSVEIVRNQILGFLAQEGIPYQNVGFCDRRSSDGNKYDHYIRFAGDGEDLLGQLEQYISENFRVKPTIAQIKEEHSEVQERLEEQSLDLLTQLEDHQKEIAALKAKNKLFEHQNQTLMSKSKEEDTADQLDTLALCKALAKEVKPDYILEICGNFFSDRLIVLETAVDSAKKINAKGVGGTIFEMIWNLVTAYRDQMLMPDMSDSPIDIFGANIFSTHESSSTMNSKRARRERTFPYNGNALLMEAHLKIGNNYRMHFDWLKEERKIIIGHCGIHLFVP